jgi:hypothetical protein
MRRREGALARRRWLVHLHTRGRTYAKPRISCPSRILRLVCFLCNVRNVFNVCTVCNVCNVCIVCMSCFPCLAGDTHWRICSTCAYAPTSLCAVTQIRRYADTQIRRYADTQSLSKASVSVMMHARTRTSTPADLLCRAAYAHRRALAQSPMRSSAHCTLVRSHHCTHECMHTGIHAYMQTGIYIAYIQIYRYTDMQIVKLHTIHAHCDRLLYVNVDIHDGRYGAV